MLLLMLIDPVQNRAERVIEAMCNVFGLQLVGWGSKSIKLVQNFHAAPGSKAFTIRVVGAHHPKEHQQQTMKDQHRRIKSG